MYFFECDTVPITVDSIRYGTWFGDNTHVKLLPQTVYFEIFYKYPGDSTFYINDSVIHLREATVGYLPLSLGNIRRYEIDYRKDSTAINLFFTCTAPELFPNAPQFVSCAAIPGMDKLFEQINLVWNHRELGYYGETLSLYYRILTALRRHNTAAYLPEARFRLIEDAVDYLGEHFLDPDFDVYALAAMSGISESYFKRIFQRKFGATPKQYVISRRMNHARGLLIDGEKNITRIAELCGYSNIYYFSQAFRNFYGISPQSFLKTCETGKIHDSAKISKISS